MMQMFYCSINNVHVDYAALIWEGLHYSLMHPTVVIPYPRFAKIFIDHILTMKLDIPKRTNEPYHKVENDKAEVNKARGARDTLVLIFWMSHVKDLVALHFGINCYELESYILIPRRKQPDLETSILTAKQIFVNSLDEATRVSIATTRSIKEYEAQQAIKKVEEHLMDEDIENLVKEGKEELAEASLIRRKGKHSLEIKDTPITTPSRSPRTITNSFSSDKERLQELTTSKP
ncbi:retrovirus-related pol polyprotein from transposon TNT 1-94 [Tanacetum coccineum]